MASCYLQVKDGRKGDASGRPKNTEQSGVQRLKDPRKPEDVRKQRVNLLKSALFYICGSDDMLKVGHSLNAHLFF